MEQPQEPQGMKSLIPDAPREGAKPGTELPGPVFESGPGWGKQLSGWLKRNFITKLLPLIAIIVVIVGIVLITGNDKEKTELTGPPETLETEQKETIKEETIITEIGEEKIFKTTAQRGEGITHLARRTLKEYLKDKPELEDELQAEHKIFIEDYLKDQHGERLLEIGEVLEFSEDDIEAAIETAKDLSDSDLTNLSQYVPLVSGL